MPKTMAVLDGETITNLIWCNAEEPDSETLVSTGERPVGIGDTCRAGRFYREGIEILTPLEEARKQLAELEDRSLDQAAALNAIYSGEVSG